MPKTILYICKINVNGDQYCTELHILKYSVLRQSCFRFSYCEKRLLNNFITKYNVIFNRINLVLVCFLNTF